MRYDCNGNSHNTTTATAAYRIRRQRRNTWRNQSRHGAVGALIDPKLVVVRVTPQCGGSDVGVVVQNVEKRRLVKRPPKVAGLRRAGRLRFGRNVPRDDHARAVLARLRQRRLEPRHLAARIGHVGVVLVALVIEHRVDREDAQLAAVHVRFEAAKVEKVGNLRLVDPLRPLHVDGHGLRSTQVSAATDDARARTLPAAGSTTFDCSLETHRCCQ